MSNNIGKINLSSLIDMYQSGILIPEIQRDYVMGAGGKGKNGEDKLKLLLEKINDCAKADKDFDFSCIITHRSEDDNFKLEIYDGQQRLTTLIFLYLYLCKKEEKELLLHSNWLVFAGRPHANQLFSQLVLNELKIQDICVEDFTSFSIQNLLKESSSNKYNSITSDYLLNKVNFDMVSIASQNEIEQFFMDLNSGIQLKEFEIYKAKLNYQVNKLKETNPIKIECLENWSYKLDNEWLNLFTPFASFEHPEEEYEIAFIKYCIKMTAIDYYDMERIQYIKGQYLSEVDFISIDSNIAIQILEKVFKIMNSLMKIDFENIKVSQKISGILNYSWGDDEEDSNSIILKNNYDKRGAFWSLENSNYETMLYHIIKNVILYKEKQGDLHKDVLLWCFVTTIDWNTIYKLEYLRNIKILLNNNVFINENAWYECQGKGQYLYYCKHIVCGIPQYYGKHMKDKESGSNNKLIDILNLNFYINNEKLTLLHLNSKQLSLEVLNNLINLEHISERIKVILQKRRSMISNISESNYLQFVHEENGLHGILKRFNNYEEIESKKNQMKTEFYESKVTIEWPSRSGKSTYKIAGKNELVYVLIKCFSDKLFEDIVSDSSTSIKQIYEKYSLELEKTFWVKYNSPKEIGIYKLINRKTSTSSTYNKHNSESGWANYWIWNGDTLSKIY